MRTLTSISRRSARQHKSSVFLMSVTTAGGPDQSIWTSEDKSWLVQFLLDCHAEAGNGANFKSTVWNAAAEELSKHVTKGGPKTAASCKSKWDRVCISNHIHVLTSTNDVTTLI